MDTQRRLKTEKEATNIRQNLSMVVIYITIRESWASEVSSGGQRRDAMDTQLQKTTSTSASSPFPGTMTTETTVSKGQEFFSPGQTRGIQGGH